MMTIKGMDKVIVGLLIFTLSFSVVSIASPSYLTGAAADDEAHEEQYSIKKEIGEHSHVELELSAETEVEIEINNDLDDGEYAVSFNCTDPVISESFPDHLHVMEGQGELEHHLELPADTYNGCKLSIGGLVVAFDPFTVFEVHEEESEDDLDEEDEEEHEDEEESYENKGGNVRIEKDLGENSEVHFKAEKGSARVMVEIEEGDLADGSYNVTIVCKLPESSLTFSEKLKIKEGEGEFEGKLTLRSADYSECIVSAGNLSVMLPDFTIMAGVHHHGGEDHRAESGVDVKGDGTVRLEVVIRHPGFGAGTYDVLLSCKEPVGLSVLFNGALVVDETGKGKFRIETSLGPGSYGGCEASIEEESGKMVIATFDAFRVAIEHSEEDDRPIEEKRKQRKHAILERLVAGEIHKRHIDAAKASSTGDYQPGTAYNLTAAGTVEGDDEMTLAEVNADFGVWKSNRAIILLDVLGGTVVVGEDSYTIRIGYAVYSMQSDALRLRALATDDATGEIVSLKLRGDAMSENAAFPTAGGDAIELQFEGNSGRFSNQIGSWELFLDGTIEA